MHHIHYTSYIYGMAAAKTSNGAVAITFTLMQQLD